ncbi:MAG: phosphoglucosamine mutase [Candidatus Dadabacteria bacterium]|nr:phosphoglucosamine mutase [Candidatus Dadabacteria bacterium]MYA47695.1 phosphoglucosamine mutase [Candidatus Dadabacteria bacterium]MYG82662.1 phosphoglucosamine mutase [Candidatus Dadabacteria bacterium]MYK49795.1 phosphoglucosamine mutase [Candidatus Dadabacteria bacterium]
MNSLSEFPERKIFGTDGIRGVTNTYPMTPEISLALGKALTKYLSEKTGGNVKILVGKDTRLSGYVFEQAIASGITSMGADVLLVGPLPTPAIAFLTSNMRATAGVVISASHNPYTDNGIKIFDSTGFKLPDETEMEIENMVLGGERIIPPPLTGKAKRIEDAVGRYIVFLKNTFPKDLTLDGLRVVIDCANGAAYKVAPIIFQELGAQIIRIGTEPDGTNINVDCGSLKPEILSQEVVRSGSDIGIALDGDADRVVFCDENGNEVDGDHVLAICSSEMMEAGTLSTDTVVATQMSNMALENYLSEKGLKLERTRVGDRYVVEAMRKLGANLGGEKSGHLLFLDHSTTGDGLLASLQILSIMKKKGKSLSELAGIIDMFPQILNSLEIREKKPFEEIPGLVEIVRESEDILGDKGRINLRYSGTELLARVMVEGESETLINRIASRVSSVISENIGTGNP